MPITGVGLMRGIYNAEYYYYSGGLPIVLSQYVCA